MKTTGGSAVSRSPTPSVDEVPEPPHSEPVTTSATTYDARPRSTRPSPPTRRLTSPTVNTWTVTVNSRASNNSTLTFRPPPRAVVSHQAGNDRAHRRCGRRCAVPLVLLVWPGVSSTAPGPSTSVAPQPSTTRPTGAEHRSADTRQCSPATTTASPATSGRGHQFSAGGSPYPLARPAAPEPTQKPDIGVTRTPVTRAPISVAPSHGNHPKQLGHSRGQPKR